MKFNNKQQDASGESQGDATELNEKIAELEQQLAQAKQEATENQDRYLRTLAEMDNFKKRMERVSSENIYRARKDLLGKVIGVMDNLDRALSHESADPESLRQGLRMIRWQLAQLLEQEGLKRVESVGQPFDPRMHDAFATAHSEEHPEGTVVEELRGGYLLGDDVVRPAQVRVSMGPQPSDQTPENKE